MTVALVPFCVNCSGRLGRGRPQVQARELAFSKAVAASLHVVARTVVAGVMKHVSAREVQLALEAGYDFVVVLEMPESAGSELPIQSILSMAAMLRGGPGSGGGGGSVAGVHYDVRGSDGVASAVAAAALSRRLEPIKYVVFAEMDQLHWQRPR